MRRWVPSDVFHFSIRRLLVLTTAFALVLTFSPQLDDMPFARALTTIYLLFFVSWCIMVSYTVLLRIRSRRKELRDRLEKEYQRAKQNHSASDE